MGVGSADSGTVHTYTWRIVWRCEGLECFCTCAVVVLAYGGLRPKL